MAWTAQEDAALRAMLHRGEVRDVLERYFHSIDSYDTEALADCFCADAQFEFNANTDDRKVLTGADAIAAFFRERRNNFKAQCHFLNHVAITLEGEGAAAADVFAMSNIVFEDRIAVRGLRYRDRLVRGTDGRWRIHRRVHTPLWQYNGTPVPPFTASTGAKRA